MAKREGVLLAMVAGAAALWAASAGAQGVLPGSGESMPLPPSARTPSAAEPRPQPQRREPEKRTEPRKEEPRRAQPAAKPQQQAPAAASPPAAVAPPSAKPTPQMVRRKEPLTPERNRPPARLLIDCKDAPPTAVLTLPEPLSRWATIYCTKLGHMFSTNDRYFSAYPGTGIRGSMTAAELTGRKGEVGHAAHFTKITYEKLTEEQAKPLKTGLTLEASKIVEGEELFKIDLTTDTGQTFSLVAVDPASDPFWVIPVVNGRLNNRGFYVASLDYVNSHLQ